jgi:hypothetical protein
VISKNQEINDKANPPAFTGSRSGWEKNNYQNPNPILRPISVKLPDQQRNYLEDLVRDGTFLSRSEAIRYCIQLSKDIEIFVSAFASEIINGGKIK